MHQRLCVGHVGEDGDQFGQTAAEKLVNPSMNVREPKEEEERFFSEEDG